MMHIFRKDVVPRKCSIVSLCQTIADQNGLIFEIGGDSGEGFFIKFGVPSNSGGYNVEYVDGVDPTKDNVDLLLAIPKIYRAAKNLLASRVDDLNESFKDLVDKKE